MGVYDKREIFPAHLNTVWLLNQKNNKYFKVYYMQGTENMGDHPSNAHTGAIHVYVRP